MSRASIRFLRMLLPSGNSRVSLTLNSLIRALFQWVFPWALPQGLFSVRSFAGTFTVRYFAEDFSVHSFAGAFPVASFAGALSVHSFVGAFSVRSIAVTFSVRSFAGLSRALFPCAVSQGLFSVRCFAGAFSVRSFKLEFWLMASFEWIDMLDASFLNFFSIIARVLDQFWASLRGNKHTRDWINWNWDDQKKTARGAAPDKIIPKTKNSI